MNTFNGSLRAANIAANIELKHGKISLQTETLIIDLVDFCGLTQDEVEECIEEYIEE